MSNDIPKNSTITPISSNPGPTIRPLIRIRQIIQTHRARAQPADMSPEMMRDIGLTREAAIKESQRGNPDFPTGRFK